MTDALLLTAIALAAAAVGTATYQQFEWDAASAVAAGFATFVTLVLLQSVFGGGRSRQLQNDELERLTVEIERAKGELRPAAQRVQRAPAGVPDERIAAALGRRAAVPDLRAGPTVAPSRRESQPAVPHAPAPAPAKPAAETPAALPSMFDIWSVRPAAARAELAPQRGLPGHDHLLQADPAMRIGGQPQRGPGRAEPSVVSEADVEVLQAAIRRLVDQVDVEAQTRAVRPAVATAPPPSATRTPPDIAIDISVDGLHVASQAMRQSVQQPATQRRNAPPPLPPRGVKTEMPVPTPERRIEQRATQPPQMPAPRGGPPPVGAMHARIGAIAAAITAGRFDVLLEPILGLEDRHARHYEVSLRLHGIGDASAELAGLGGNGLLALFDSARIARSAEMALQLADRGKQGRVFSRYEAESLGDNRFLAGLQDVGRRREGLPSLLVLSFAQSAVRHFAGAQWAAIADMHALGFRFALTAVTDLDMDFEFLSAAGFEFVKLDADVFLEGMPAAGEVIPSGDICRHLGRLGLTAVVEHIDDPDKLERLFGLGVLYGQGKLFGGALPVRSEALSSDAA